MRELVTAVSVFPLRIILFLVFCPRPAQGSPHSQMDDPVTSALSPSRTLGCLLAFLGIRPHASRAWWSAGFRSQRVSLIATSTPGPSVPAPLQIPAPLSSLVLRGSVFSS
jgi:hypothetical protein